jgi:hypothetical protein
MAGVVVATAPPECGAMSAVASTTARTPPAVTEIRRRVVASAGGASTRVARVTVARGDRCGGSTSEPYPVFQVVPTSIAGFTESGSPTSI